MVFETKGNCKYKCTEACGIFERQLKKNSKPNPKIKLKKKNRQFVEITNK
jgi:hypothetical protein